MSLQSFPQCAALPRELQLLIFHFASNNAPRTLDIWTDFRRNETHDTICYAQFYTTELSRRIATRAPALLSVSRDARAECLKCYSREFGCRTRILPELYPDSDRDGDGNWDGKIAPERERVEMVTPATFWINFGVDTLVPRGSWNVVSFEDFVSRAIVEGGRRRRLASIAVDIGTSFWRDNLQDYCRARCWILNGVQEVVLYDTRSGSGSGLETGSEGIWKGSENLEKFRRKQLGERDLRFVGLPHQAEGEHEKSEELQKLQEVARYLNRVFDVIEGKASIDGDKDSDDFGFARKAEFVFMKATAKAVFRRPVVKLMRLCASFPEGEES